MRITINRTGKPNNLLWKTGYACWLIKKIFGFYIIGYTKDRPTILKGEYNG